MITNSQLFNKEDIALSQDVEVFESTTNMFDSPIEVLMECFPDEENPKERLHSIYVEYARTYLDNPSQYTTKEIITRISNKARKSTQEIDIEIKYLIEQMFVAELEYKTELSATIISTIPKELWMNKDIMRSALAVTEDEKKYIKKKPEELNDKIIYDNKLIKGYR